MTGRTVASEVAETFRKLVALGGMGLPVAWAKHFGTDSDSPEFFQALAQMASKLEQLDADVRAAAISEKSRGLYLNAISTFRGFVSLRGLTSKTTNHVESETEAFNLLHLLDDVLLAIDGRDINPATLEALKTDLNDLLASLDDAEIDARLKAFLRRQIADLLWAVTNFEAIGIDGLSRVYGASLSEIHRAVGMKGADSTAAKTWLRKAGDFAKKMGAGVIFAAAVAGAADGMLEHSAHLIDVIGGHDTDAAKAVEGASPKPARPTSKKA